MERPSKTFFPKLNINRFYTVFVSEYDPNFYFPGESHEMWEFSCVLKGMMGLTSDVNTYNCMKNEVFIHPPNVFHTCWMRSDEPVRLLTISFLGDGLERYVPHGKFILTDRECSMVNALVQEILDASEDGALLAATSDGKMISKPVRRSTEQIVKNLFESICLSLNRRKDEHAESDSDRDAVLFSDIAGYLQQHVDEMLDTKRICNDCGIGLTALKELFRVYTGAGVMKYYNHLRVRRAIELIAEGHSMADISGIMHFSSQNYFSTFFRHQTGRSPSRYYIEEKRD